MGRYTLKSVLYHQSYPKEWFCYIYTRPIPHYHYCKLCSTNFCATKCENHEKGLNIFCGDDKECFAWCDDETKLPAGGKENFNCLEYTLDSIPFPTECKSKFCAPPSVPNNVIQDCTAMVRKMSLEIVLLKSF